VGVEYLVCAPPGSAHWHGAAPQPLHDPLATLDVDDDGNPTTWGDHVADGEYNTASPD
jgi:hypothetical protein